MFVLVETLEDDDMLLTARNLGYSADRAVLEHIKMEKEKQAEIDMNIWRVMNKFHMQWSVDHPHPSPKLKQTGPKLSDFELVDVVAHKEATLKRYADLKEATVEHLSSLNIGFNGNYDHYTNDHKIYRIDELTELK
jgi:hypothetical protein